MRYGEDGREISKKMMAFAKKKMREREKTNMNKIDLLSIGFSFSFNWKRKEIERESNELSMVHRRAAYECVLP